ncbi:MAG: T9SS type A sorting domain-containing protein, partial [Ignavibacteriaceae bacterium]
NAELVSLKTASVPAIDGTIDPSWASCQKLTATVTVPDPGTLRGIAVNDAGNILYISNYDAKKVYCYIGDPVNGYTLYPGFNLEFSDSTITQDSTTYLQPGPWGLGFMEDKNILFMAADISFKTGNAYEYGKMFLVNPNTGELLDTINVAKWNFDQTGSYSNRGNGGNQGNVSGYTSTYNVEFDENHNVYSQSYYGWTVEKWLYTTTLPAIDITITSIERTDNFVPNKFNLSQNYPNPFNPSTTIEFSLNEDSEINLSIYSITGELVADLVKSSFFTKGNYKFSFDASKLSSGTYIYTLKNGSKQISKKMTLIK